MDNIPVLTRKLTEMPSDPEARMCKVCQIIKLPIDWPEWRSQCLDCFKDEQQKRSASDKRTCLSCGDKNISVLDPEWITKCKDCYKKSMENGRPCKRCKRLISSDRPDFVKYCATCYKEGKENCRKCNVCGCHKINGSEPLWKTMCGMCYKELKK